MDTGAQSDGPGLSGGGAAAAALNVPDALPNPEFAGKESYTNPRTSYSRELKLRASTFAWDGRDVASVHSSRNLWSMTVQTIGSSPHLDVVMPVMVAAAAPYVGTHSETTIETKLSGTDKRIEVVSEGL
jgi:hypothetical protein